MRAKLIKDYKTQITHPVVPPGGEEREQVGGSVCAQLEYISTPLAPWDTSDSR